MAVACRVFIGYSLDVAARDAVMARAAFISIVGLGVRVGVDLPRAMDISGTR